MELGMIDYHKLYSDEELRPLVEHVNSLDEVKLKDIFDHFCGRYDYMEIKVAVYAASQNKPVRLNPVNSMTLKELQDAFDGLSLYDKENFINENEEELKSLLSDGAPVFDEDGEDTEEILLELIGRGMSEADILNQVVDDLDEVRDTLEDISDTDYYELNEEDN